MTLKVRNSGSWVTVGSGKLRAKDSSSSYPLVSPKAVYVRWEGQWLDTGYVPATGTPTDLSLKSWSVSAPFDKTASIEVQWRAPVTGVTPDSYTASLFDQTGVRLASISTTGLSAVFSNALTTNLLWTMSNYYVTVTGVSATAAPSTSEWLKIRTGQPQVTKEETTYAYGPEQSMHPIYIGETSHYADMDGSKAVDDGPPSAGALAPFVEAWVSGGRASQYGLWEGLKFGLPNSERLLTRVQVMCEPSHTVYLGIQQDGRMRISTASTGSQTWVGNISAQSLGIPPRSLLDNTYAWSVSGGSNVKSFDIILESPPTFSSIRAISLAVTSFVNLYGTPGSIGTTTPVTRTAASIPYGYGLWVDGTGKSVGLISVQGVLLTPKILGTGGSTSPFKETPQVPATAVWAKQIPSSGSGPGKLSYSLELGPLNGSVYFRQYLNGVPISGEGGYLRYPNGSRIQIWMSDIFPPGSLGYISSGGDTIPGVEAVPAWRARVQDVTVFYKESVATGTRTVIVHPGVDTTSGYVW